MIVTVCIICKKKKKDFHVSKVGVCVARVSARARVQIVGATYILSLKLTYGLLHLRFSK